ncbi:MAG: Fic family protein [Acidimicrobiales bacterium]
MKPAGSEVAVLCQWHRTLMTGSPTPERYVGTIRDQQGWIGGTSPFDAHLVTPPPDELPALLADLVDYANRSDVDPIAQAAVAHAQFEIIHPFADGNGRVGRLLVAWVRGSGPDRPATLYVSRDLLGLAGSSPGGGR